MANSQPKRNGVVDAMGGVLILSGSGNSVSMGAKFVKSCWSLHRQKGSRETARTPRSLLAGLGKEQGLAFCVCVLADLCSTQNELWFQSW